MKPRVKPSCCRSDDGMEGRPNATKSTLALRCALALALPFAAWHSQSIDLRVEHLWRNLRGSATFQHDSFEPLLVTCSVAVFSVFFLLLDVYGSALHRWRIQESDDISHWKIEGGHKFRGEFLWYWAALGIYDVLYPRRTLPLAGPTFFQVVGEVLGALLVYDFLFFWVHLACHKIPFLFKNVHSKHHTKTVMRAWESWRLSFWEEAADVGCSIIALNVLKCHPLSRAIYNVVIVYLIAELHSGYDMPWMLQNVVPFGLWAGSRRHDYHHRCGKLYFQKFFTYLDNAMILISSELSIVSKLKSQ